MLIKKTVYIPEEQFEAFERIKNKAQWFRDNLGEIPDEVKPAPIHVMEPRNSELYAELDFKKPAKLQKNLAEIKPDFKPCKHGADPKLCKFAKPGKPCKKG